MKHDQYPKRPNYKLRQRLAGGVAGSLLVGAGGGLILHEATEGSNLTPTEAVNTIAVLNPGVRIHNSPTLAEGNSGDGDSSVITQLASNQHLVINRPQVVEGAGNNTIWWKFDLKQSDGATTTGWVDYSAIQSQHESNGSPYIDFHNYPSYHSNEAVAVHTNGRGQAVASVEGQNIVVGMAELTDAQHVPNVIEGMQK